MIGGNPRLIAMLRYSDEENAIVEIAEAINKSEGDIRTAAKRLRIGKRTLFRWCSEYPVLAKVLKAARDKKVSAA